jgi:hypothetical protein
MREATTHTHTHTHTQQLMPSYEEEKKQTKKKKKKKKKKLKVGYVVQPDPRIVLELIQQWSSLQPVPVTITAQITGTITECTGEGHTKRYTVCWNNTFIGSYKAQELLPLPSPKPTHVPLALSSMLDNIADSADTAIAYRTAKPLRNSVLSSRQALRQPHPCILPQSLSQSLPQSLPIFAPILPSLPQALPHTFPQHPTRTGHPHSPSLAPVSLAQPFPNLSPSFSHPCPILSPSLRSEFPPSEVQPHSSNDVSIPPSALSSATMLLLGTSIPALLPSQSTILRSVRMLQLSLFIDVEPQITGCLDVHGTMHWRE